MSLSARINTRRIVVMVVADSFFLFVFLNCLYLSMPWKGAVLVGVDSFFLFVFLNYLYQDLRKDTNCSGNILKNTNLYAIYSGTA